MAGWADYPTRHPMFNPQKPPTMNEISIAKVKTFAYKNTITGKENLYHNTGEREWDAPYYTHYFKQDTEVYGQGGWNLTQEDFDELVDTGAVRIIEEYDKPKKWIEGRIWEAIEADGHKKYDAFMSLIKDTLCPLNPEENEKAYFIEDVVNERLGDLFTYLEKRF